MERIVSAIILEIKVVTRNHKQLQCERLRQANDVTDFNSSPQCIAKEVFNIKIMCKMLYNKRS